MAKGKKTGGRVAGVPNKLTRSVREAFQFAFDEMGGGEALYTWAIKNSTEFYKLYSRLIPTDVAVSGTVDVSHHQDDDRSILSRFFTAYTPKENQ